MKGLSIFYNGKKIRMHPNAYTDHGCGKGIPPFRTLEAGLSDEDFSKNIQDMLDHSKSGVPFKMITQEEVEAYFKAFGVRADRQMGIGVHITLEDGQYTVTPINERGLFGEPEVVAQSLLLHTAKNCLGLEEREIA